jgi:multidrug efflux pump subunit AcrA (membrane-fusion protein)
MTEPAVAAATQPVAAPPAPAQHWPLPGQHPLVIVFIVLVGIAAVLAVLRAWELPPFSSGVQVTDNAYLRGRTTIIAPQVSGYVVAVETKDFAGVQAGQVLVRIGSTVGPASSMNLTVGAESRADALLAHEATGRRRGGV